LIDRRHFLLSTAAGSLAWRLPETAAAAPFPVRPREAPAYEQLFSLIEPGHDEFAGEKTAAAIADVLDKLIGSRILPLDPGFRGGSPLPAGYRTVAPDVAVAEFDRATAIDFAGALGKWLDSLGAVRAARYFVLPRDRVRYEIASSSANGQLQYRVGLWKQVWHEGRLLEFEPIEETLVTAAKPLFEDVTAWAFRESESFRQQLSRGVPYWRAKIDSASGIDVYGNNGIAVGDIDGDGFDEIYVCQPGGLPNRLYKNRGDGTLDDVTDHAGVGLLDDTTCALFLDLRGIGRQDLVVATIGSPLLFLNEGNGRFREKKDAFRFRSAPQGTFTGMAAADYDRDGRVDLYLCTYIYFQSEDQYRYPVPYYDSRNGPPNFLFHNELTEDGGGYFEDVTAQTGIGENNDRYSFAPAWCDFNGSGWPGLYVANDFGRGNLYRNERGRFRDVAREAGVGDPGPGMSAAWFDYNGDGQPDLYVSNMWTAAGQRVVEDKAFQPGAGESVREAYRRHARGNSLYRNRGDGSFASTAAERGVEMGRWACGADGIDFDNDGVPEIYITCGMLTNSSPELMSFFWRQVVARSPASSTASPPYENGWNALNQLIRGEASWNGREPNVLYARRGERFYDYSGVSGLDFAEDSRAFAVTDFDGDGNLDLVLKSRLGPQLRVLRNRWGSGGKAIAFDLRGTKSNRDAIGARVEVEHAGKKVVRYLQAGSGYLAQHTKRLFFGLGDSPAPVKVTVLWPSGLTQEIHNLAAGSRYQITEGAAEWTSDRFVSAARAVADGAAGIPVDNQPGLSSTWLLEPVPLPEVRTGPALLCLYAGTKPATPTGLPFQALDLGAAPPEAAAMYSLFRSYLFDYRVDYRAGLELPLPLLIDKRGFVHKIYASVPADAELRRDLIRMREPDRARLALPFDGRYVTLPHRNYLRLGAAFLWAGYNDAALVYLSEVVRTSPDNAKAHLAVGQIHLEAGRPADARTHLETAARLNPASADVWTNLGSLEAAAGNHRAALMNFEKALSIAPGSVFVLVSAAREHGKLGDAQEAEQMLSRAIELDPANADAANQMGLLLAGQGRLEEALKRFQQAIASQRNHAGAINNLGVIYMELQKPQEAIAAFRYGIESAPDDETAYLNLARAYGVTGDRERAGAILRELLLRKPGNTAARRGLDELGSDPLR
jgi:tetratricopeptide (TPR) repeat protein